MPNTCSVLVLALRTDSTQVHDTLRLGSHGYQGQLTSVPITFCTQYYICIQGRQCPQTVGQLANQMLTTLSTRHMCTKPKCRRDDTTYTQLCRRASCIMYSARRRVTTGKLKPCGLLGGLHLPCLARTESKAEEAGQKKTCADWWLRKVPKTGTCTLSPVLDIRGMRSIAGCATNQEICAKRKASTSDARD